MRLWLFINSCSCFSFLSFPLFLVLPLSSLSFCLSLLSLVSLLLLSWTARMRLCYVRPFPSATARRTLSWNISQYDQFLVFCGFGVMCIVGDQRAIYDGRFDKHHDTVVGVSTKCWAHCGGRGATSSWRAHESTESRFFWCYEEVNYELWLSPIVAAHGAQSRMNCLRQTFLRLSGFPFRTVNYTLLRIGCIWLGRRTLSIRSVAASAVSIFQAGTTLSFLTSSHWHVPTVMS